MTDKQTIVITHACCLDGHTSAWVCWLKFGDTAEYISAKHGDAPPDVTGKDVIIADFSYPRAQLEAMAASAKSIRVFDHHVTAQKDLQDLPYCVFDMNRSGAGITWAELHGPRLCEPAIVSYVQDRDLWRFNIEHSKEVNAVIGATEQTFEEWSALRQRITSDFHGVVSVGSALLRQVNRYVSEMSKQARTVHFEGHAVPVVNAPYINTSELVGKLAESATFAMGWYQRRDGMYVYSLRSRGDYDVSALAKKYGGGGHRQAAGFSSAVRVDQ